MKLEDYQVNMTWHSLTVCRSLMEKELATKRGALSPSDLQRAEGELAKLITFLDAVGAERSKHPVPINPFLFYAQTFVLLTDK